MPQEKIHFVTGRLAESALRRRVENLSRSVGFDYSIQVMPITVAALINVQWMTKRLSFENDCSRIVIPGYVSGDLREVQEQIPVLIERGPRDLRFLDEFFGQPSITDDELTQWDIEIIAEINHAPQLTFDQIRNEAGQLSRDGADRIDIGCDPGQTWSGVGQCVERLCDEGFRISIDSLNPREIEPALNAGADLVLSVNESNLTAAMNWNCEVVVIPDDTARIESMDASINQLSTAGIPLRIDPILEPIGFGFAASLERYMTARRRWPEAEMMMGIGNLTEMSEVDSAAVNFLLLAICQELGIRSVLTTQVIPWAKTSVRECEIARRMVHFAIEHRQPPKHIHAGLVSLRDASVAGMDDSEIVSLARNIRDNNYRIFAENDQLHVIASGLHLQGNDAFDMFEQLLATNPGNVDASHAFYLGYELCKASVALALGKQYAQDEALDWGFLTVPETNRRRLRRSRKNTASDDSDH